MQLLAHCHCLFIVSSQSGEETGCGEVILLVARSRELRHLDEPHEPIALLAITRPGLQFFGNLDRPLPLLRAALLLGGLGKS